MAKNSIGSKTKSVVKDATKAVVKAKDSAVSSAAKALETVTNVSITPEDILYKAVQLPIARVDRATFLKKELVKHYPEETVDLAIKHNPAYAGIDKYTINDIANQVIKYETNKVSSISFATGLPGGITMAATVTADVVQYFAFLLRAMQELAYLYGFEEFDFDKDSVDSNTMNEMLVFLGVMFGAQGANVGVKAIAQSAAQKVSKTLANKALTKTTVYPIVKKTAQAVGIKMTKQIFADGVSKVIPVLGGAVSGGLTYVTYKKCCLRLKHSFWNLSLCDVEFYEKIKKGDIDEMPDEEIIEIDENDIDVEADELENI
jgi:hypothetical protein